jgi:hypothetical protein
MTSQQGLDRYYILKAPTTNKASTDCDEPFDYNQISTQLRKEHNQERKDQQAYYRFPIRLNCAVV